MVMNFSDDISPILKRWEFQESKNIRRLRAANGHEIIQVRLPLGIEQYEINGRPDGLRPGGFESWLDRYIGQEEVFGREFLLDEQAFERLQSEGLLYYYRYLLFFQIQDYDLCVRDTARNLRLLDFVKRYAGKPEHAEALEQYRPYILRMHYMARALLRLKEEHDLNGAIRLLRLGLKEIQEIPALAGNDVFDFERTRSVKSIKDLLSQLEKQVPPSKMERLHRQMQDAIAQEDYEKAATLRDQIRRMGRRKKSSR
ncbi:MAG: UvrB/UvrC motif-containing protein [Planctomycetes bacterium]|nr:UvrB/UvrC motif-containing protein [Planctomycetota bacterium]